MAIEKRWLQGEDLKVLAPVIHARGWGPFNPYLTRALCAFEKQGDGTEALVGFVVLQMIPHTEPLYVDPEHRGTGLAEELSEEIVAFLRENQVRGWIAIAESPHSAILCEKNGMNLVPFPVYFGKGEVAA